MPSMAEKSKLLNVNSAEASWHLTAHSSRRRTVVSLWTAVAALSCAYLVFNTFVTGDNDVLAALRLGKGKKHQPHSHDICLTPECVHASSEILYNLSPDYESIDACTDFEELVCGGWKERHDLRPDQGDAFTGTIMAENSQMLLRHILEAPYPKDSAHSYFSPMQLAGTARGPDESNFNKMKAAYDACMDETTIQKDGAKPLIEIINHVKELYPVSISDVNMKDERLQTAISYLYELGITAIIAPYTGADDKDPDTVVVAITPPGRIGLPAKELYEDEKIVEKYKAVISDVFSGLFSGLDIESVGDDVAEFEKKLAAAAPKEEDANDVTKYYNPMSLMEASDLLPQVGLATIVEKLAPKDVKVDRVINMSPSYMNKTAATLDNTDSRVLQNYLVWKAVQALYPYVDSDAVTPYKRFVNELQGRDPDSAPERWRTCVRHVDDGLGWILSRFFVEKAFSAKAKEFGDQIVTDIKNEFIKKLRATKWMEKKVQNLAIDKVHNIIQKIGYPTKSPDIMDPEALENYYHTVTINPSTYFANALAMSRLEINNMWSALGKPVDREKWDMSVPTVNAYYNPPGNEIVFPAGIMQFPVFDVNVPQYLSYGAFASVAGHELSHAFDSTGRHYDQNGNYTDWWTDATVQEFTKRADCFINQYSNFTIPGPDDRPLHVNGKLTLGENIADAGGVSAAFKAWKIREKQNPRLNQMLPGLQGKFTKDQLFFVSYANWWCGKSRDEFARQRIYTDPHAPKWARILGTMANSREFLNAFGCKKEPVCELW
ncbi:uncharacterized protein PV09_04536 [Verruconis gallopava]|uniref:Endothelin-converting enzyme 1 n=1 Tax=Verruconis gallopava TaxID=253628 RepID=A0A0D2ACM1_9PEZI|nr:uncharacterized protein PV09_04536 [Verruconis gallopava]KIW04230.1 hypothetical protein PV09_04536 [Verruconis gallopava]